MKAAAVKHKPLCGLMNKQDSSFYYHSIAFVLCVFAFLQHSVWCLWASPSAIRKLQHRCVRTGYSPCIIKPDDTRTPPRTFKHLKTRRLELDSKRVWRLSQTELYSFMFDYLNSVNTCVISKTTSCGHLWCEMSSYAAKSAFSSRPSSVLSVVTGVWCVWTWFCNVRKNEDGII